MKALILGILLLNFVGCTQNNDRTHLGETHAQKELAIALKKQDHNIIDNKTVIIKDTVTAVNIAQPILFGIYGRDNITKQQPYEIYHIENYWVISGTLQKGDAGGTFLIIIDDRNGNILKITHGK